MNDFADRVERARASIDLHWDDARARKIERAAHELARRQRRTRAGAVAVAAVLLVTGGALGFTRWRANGARDALTVHFADGSTAQRRDTASLVRELSSAPQLEVAQLEQGAATFDVVPDAQRLFRVEVANITIEVLGTRFLVERGESALTVTVERGRVRVRAPQGVTELTAGERQEFSFAAAQAVEAPHVDLPSPVKDAPRRMALPHTSPPPARGWKSLAEEGDYDRAYDVLHASPPVTVRDDAAELFLAADVARLSHHPADAIAPLRTLVARHAADPRAPLAAFTLGNVLLELGSPREAAAAFVEAQQLDPAGPMAEDALAREVEGLSRAGDVQAARARAEAYVARYPLGRRIRTVRRFGNLE